MSRLSERQGGQLVGLARRVLVHDLLDGPDPGFVPAGSFFSQKRGLFVSLHAHPGHDLRGCIGFTVPVSLWEGVVHAARAAAFEDPRFSPLLAGELSRVVVEVSVLTPKKPLSGPPESYPERVRVGTHGLVVSKGLRTGLLLPQVPGEFGWDSRTFLEECCLKAGLPKDGWNDPKTEVSVFEAQVFAETEPGGAVIEKTGD